MLFSYTNTNLNGYNARKESVFEYVLRSSHTIYAYLITLRVLVILIYESYLLFKHEN